MTRINAEPDSNFLEQDGHRTHYLASGPEDGPLIILLHGWPELAISWRSQLPCLAYLGYRAIAPDMRGYGQSSVYTEQSEYQLKYIVDDMLALLAHLGRKAAIWVGHDWGSPVVWAIASHHPDCCNAIASLCVPYQSVELGIDELVRSVDRDVYPEQDFPAGQWEYMRFYEENFQRATSQMDVNPENFIKLIFRQGDPSKAGQPAGTAFTRIQNGWFGGQTEPPESTIDETVVLPEELLAYGHALSQNGFFGPNSWYMNHQLNFEYAQNSVNAGNLDMPVLFIAARYDYTCEAITSSLAAKMRQSCSALTETIIDSGHWMAQEKPVEVNQTLCHWLHTHT
jgi:soluble epoxide hydrolase / lipid-phosphate phosphatase